VKTIGFRDIIEFLVIPLLTLAVYILWDMNKNIGTLNLQVGVIISERSVDRETIKDHESRIRILELKGSK